MKFFSLASGSSGNCFLIDNNKDLLMIDVGIPYNKIKEKVEELNYKMSDIKYVLITHTHVDHIRSINSFNMDRVYSSIEIPGLKNRLPKKEEIRLGSYKITSFPLSHDVPCSGYKVESDDESLVYITDTGYINYKLIPLIRDATYYIFESNHDIKMLMESSRPIFLKNRILSDKGHLNNEDASNTLLSLLGDKTEEIFLAHISKDCNTKKLAYDTLIDTLSKNNYDYSKLFIEPLDRENIVKGGRDNEKNPLFA